MDKDQQSIYKSESSTAESGVAFWSFSANVRCVSKVVPDGCIDIISKKRIDSQSSTWFISEISESVYDVVSDVGDQMCGIRLKPGINIDQFALSQWIKAHDIDELFASDQVDEFCQQLPALSESLECLSFEEINSVQDAADQLGISVRTLQRVVKNGTQRSPYFWLSLSRMRRTVRSLHKFDCLAEAAAVFHFSDQAHMNRDLKKWLGLPPSQIKKDRELISLVNELGYA